MTHCVVKQDVSKPFFARVIALLASVFAVALTLAPSTAMADQSGDDSSPQIQYRKAHEAIDAKNWEEARRILGDLWARSHTYDVGSSLVIVEYHLEHFAEAGNYAAFALQNVPPMEKPEEIERLKRVLDRIKQRVGALTVVVNRPGADVVVDAQVIGKSPLPADFYVNVGPHVVSAQLEASTSAESRVDALAGQSYPVELTIPESSPAPSPTPAAAAPNGEGSYPDTPKPRNYTPAIVAAGVGGAVLAGSIASLIVSVNKQADADDRASKLSGTGQNECAPGIDAERASECSKILDLSKEATTLRNVAFVGFGVTAVAGVATWLLWPHSHPSSAGARVTPSVSVSQKGAFASVVGAF
jgi:hypothetical protein